MVMLPQTVRLEPSVINGVKVVKQVYADGSYGIQDENTGCVKVYHQDGKKQWFLPVLGAYKLTAEETPDGILSFKQKNGIVETEYETRKEESVRSVWDETICDVWDYHSTRKVRDYKITFFDGSIYNVTTDNSDNEVLGYGYFDKTSQFTELNIRLDRDSKTDVGLEIIKIASEKSLDGSEHVWNHYTWKLYTAKLLDGTEHEWYRNGQLKFEKLPDGTEHEWYENGKKKFERLPDGTEGKWQVDGKPIYETLADGSLRIWNKTGTLITGMENGNGEVTVIDGKQYFVDGKIIREKLNNGTLRTYDNGDLSKAFLSDGTVIEFYGNEKLLKKIELPDGKSVGWYADGQKKFEQQPNGTRQEWYLNGTLATKILHSNTADKHIISESRYDENGNLILFKHYNKKGKDDTRLYLAKKKVAADQAKKSEEIRAKGVEVKNADGTTRKKTTVKKLNPIVKAWKLHKALKDVDARK